MKCQAILCSPHFQLRARGVRESSIFLLDKNFVRRCLFNGQKPLSPAGASQDPACLILKLGRRRFYIPYFRSELDLGEDHVGRIEDLCVWTVFRFGSRGGGVIGFPNSEGACTDRSCASDSRGQDKSVSFRLRNYACFRACPGG